MKHGIALAATVAVLAAYTTSDPSTLHAQQHSYTPEQIEEGRTIYEANCGRCHGDNGSGVAGVDLFKQIRRASSDEDIGRLIQQGIPGTAMPPHRLSNPQALSAVAFLRSMVGAAPLSGPNLLRGSATTTVDISTGNAARGKAVFTGTGTCATCHRAEGAGGTSGPDLSAIGATRPGIFGPGLPVDVPSLERSLIDPSAEIAPAYRVFQATPSSGAPVRGQLLNQDTFSLQILDSGGNLRSLPKSDLKDFGYQPSPMPSFRGRLTPQELADVLSYLLTLKGGQ